VQPRSSGFWQQQVSHKRKISSNDLSQKALARLTFNRSSQISACTWTKPKT
jgi:hypothetical protein